MLWFYFFGCSQDHRHDDLEARVQQLEALVATQQQQLLQINSAEIQKKQKKPLCIQDRPGSFFVSRGRLERVLENVELRPKLYPHQRDGEIIGLRVANVPIDWESCDFADGDLLLSINGVRLHTPRTLTDIYKRKDFIEEVEIIRTRKSKKDTLQLYIKQ